MESPSKFNRNLLSIIALTTLIVGARLAVAAMEHDNWRGAIFSMAHVLIVGAASYFILRKVPSS